MSELNSEVSDQTPGGGVATVAEPGPGSDPLRGLYRMSTTAGLGSGEYVAINTAAVVSAIVGLASAMVLLHTALLVIPVTAVIFAVVGMIQIRRRSGTEKGVALAMLGILLAVGFGGLRAKKIYDMRAQAAVDRRVIGETIDRAVATFQTGDFDKAYTEFSDGFRERVTLDTFKSRLRNIPEAPAWGKLLSGKVDTVVFDAAEDFPMTGTGEVALAYEKRSKVPLVMTFHRAPRGWQIGDIPNIFPAAAEQDPNRPQSDPSVEPTGPAGPAAPEF